MNSSYDSESYRTFGIIESDTIDNYTIIKSSRAMEKIENIFEYTQFVANKNHSYNGCIKCINGIYYLYLGYVKHLEYEAFIPIIIYSDNTINIIPTSLCNTICK